MWGSFCSLTSSSDFFSAVDFLLFTDFLKLETSVLSLDYDLFVDFLDPLLFLVPLDPLLMSSEQKDGQIFLCGTYDFVFLTS